VSRGRSFNISEGIAGKVAEEGRPFLIADTMKEKLFLDFGEPLSEIRSLLCIPIISEDGVLGVFNLSSSQPEVFNQDDQIVISAIADLAATTLSTSLLYEKFQELNKSLEEKVREKTAILKASEQKYRALVQGANDGIFIYRNGLFKFANRHFAEMLGYSTQDFSLKSLNDGVSVEPVGRHLQKIEKSSHKKQGSLRFESTITGRNGREVEVEVGVTIVEYEGKHAIQGIVRDITSRKELERLKTNFLATIAHELRTPIMVITGYNRMMLQGETGPLSPLQQKILNESKKSCDRLTSFAREVMDLPRMEAGKMELNLQEEEIGGCIEEIFREVEALARKKKISLEMKVPDEKLPKIPLDKSRIEQVIVNLTTNAINYTPEGGEIRVEVQSPTGNFLEISVTDNGIGVPEEERRDIFDEFRVGKRTGGKGGVGLGLAICKKIIEAHGGKIWLETVKKEGSRFIFTLPTEERLRGIQV
jgi:PAS domain S-box